MRLLILILGYPVINFYTGINMSDDTMTVLSIYVIILDVTK